MIFDVGHILVMMLLLDILFVLFIKEEYYKKLMYP